MGALTVISVLIVGLDFVSMVPQPLRAWRLKTTEGVSAGSQAIGIATCSAWFVYGVLLHDVTQLAANGPAIAGFAIVLVAMRRYDGLSPSVRSSTLMAGWYGLLLGVSYFFGANGIATVATLVSTIWRLPQVIVALRIPGGIGLSLASLAVSAVACVLWIAYGVLRSDIAVLVTSVWAITVIFFIAMRTVVGRRSVNSAPATVPAIEHRPSVERLAA